MTGMFYDSIVEVYPTQRESEWGCARISLLMECSCLVQSGINKSCQGSLERSDCPLAKEQIALFSKCVTPLPTVCEQAVEKGVVGWHHDLKETAFAPLGGWL